MGNEHLLQLWGEAAGHCRSAFANKGAGFDIPGYQRRRVDHIGLSGVGHISQLQGGIATIAVHKRKVKIDLGVVQWDGTERISGYIEKTTYDYTVSMGIYFLNQM